MSNLSTREECLDILDTPLYVGSLVNDNPSLPIYLHKRKTYFKEKKS